MDELLVYVRKFHMSEITDLSCLSPFEVTVKELKIHHLDQVDLSKPALFILRVQKMVSQGSGYQQWTREKYERLWNFVNMLQGRSKNTAVLLILEEPVFEILYRAVSAHVDEVLVDPFEESELCYKVTACIRKIQQTGKLLEDRKRLEEYEFNRHQKVMERILTQLLEKPEAVDFMLPEVNKRYGMNLGTNNYQAVVISVDQFELYNKDSRFLREVSLLAIHQLDTVQEIILGEVDPYGLITILNLPDHYSEPRLERELENLRQAILNLQETYGSFQASIGVGTMVKSMKDIRDSLIRGAWVQEYRMILPDQVLYADRIPDLNQELGHYLSDRSIRELCRYIAMGDDEHIRGWFNYFRSEVEPRFEKYPPAYAKFSWKMYRSVKEMEKSAKIDMFPDMKFFALQHIFDGKERMRAVETLALEICHMMRSEVSSEHQIAFHAIAYMKVHYMEPINLETIAEKCGLSTSYFSRKFKEQTGENYIDVLTEIRMKEAERLLLETEDSIEEIIEKVGYCDDKHFRKLFLKHTDMTPTAYRKKGKKS